MKRYNPVITGINARKYEERQRAWICVQICKDAADMAANEVFHMGPIRHKLFTAVFKKYLAQIFKSIMDESNNKPSDSWKNDPTLQKTMSDIDKKLIRIVGKENFTPAEDRYSA